MYVCLEACKEAFVTICMSLISLYGRYSSQLLAIIEKDGNNQFLVVVVVKSLYDGKVEHKLCVKH
ncbi:hypothetical protein CR513_57578, partial [Mucuna pruriens]